ncbi:MAG: hypothetical protein HY815_14720, partial [Candidatus Riflebacteria bacterium]|nr:hypothetical protein [Candidatus Riflebacteria bacterium]
MSGPAVGKGGVSPRINAIFNRMVPGDEALLELMQRRFAAAGLGAELYPGSIDDLLRHLLFTPDPVEPCTAHLPRELGVEEEPDRERIVAFATAGGSRLSGLVIHDDPAIASRLDRYVASVRSLDARLVDLGPGPQLFIEYAVGHEPRRFVELFRTIEDCSRVGACLDIGHVGMFHCERVFRRSHPGQSLYDLKAHTEALFRGADEVQQIVASALPVVLDTVRALASIDKPLHFHLHDGHPASTFSPLGVSDHLSFFQDVPVPFQHRG